MISLVVVCIVSLNYMLFESAMLQLGSKRTTLLPRLTLSPAPADSTGERHRECATLMETEQQNVDKWLDRAITEFSTNPLSTQLIRRLAREYTESFSIAAIRHLTTTEHAQADRFLTVLLLQQGSLFERISDPGQGSRERSVNLFKRLLAVDPSFDVKLARMLPDRSGVNHSNAYRGARAGRTLDILDETSAGRRLLPVLSHLVNSPDPSTCATATLFVGHRLKSPQWAAKQLDRSDNRVRANAVESLWGLATDPARLLLERCLDDESNRVAGNALVGLHIIGTPGIHDEIDRLVHEPKAEFRATAAWAMGRMNDPAMAPELTALVRDQNKWVRSVALRSLLNIRLSARVDHAAAIQVEPPVVVVPEPEQIIYREVPAKVFHIQLDGSSFSSRGSLME